LEAERKAKKALQEELEEIRKEEIGKKRPLEAKVRKLKEALEKEIASGKALKKSATEAKSESEKAKILEEVVAELKKKFDVEAQKLKEAQDKEIVSKKSLKSSLAEAKSESDKARDLKKEVVELKEKLEAEERKLKEKLDNETKLKSEKIESLEKEVAELKTKFDAEERELKEVQDKEIASGKALRKSLADFKGESERIGASEMEVAALNKNAMEISHEMQLLTTKAGSTGDVDIRIQEIKQENKEQARSWEDGRIMEQTKAQAEAEQLKARATRQDQEQERENLRDSEKKMEREKEYESEVQRLKEELEVALARGVALSVEIKLRVAQERVSAEVKCSMEIDEVRRKCSLDMDEFQREVLLLEAQQKEDKTMRKQLQAQQERLQAETAKHMAEKEKVRIELRNAQENIGTLNHELTLSKRTLQAAQTARDTIVNDVVRMRQDCLEQVARVRNEEEMERHQLETVKEAKMIAQGAKVVVLEEKLADLEAQYGKAKRLNQILKASATKSKEELEGKVTQSVKQMEAADHAANTLKKRLKYAVRLYNSLLLAMRQGAENAKALPRPERDKRVWSMVAKTVRRADDVEELSGFQDAKVLRSRTQREDQKSVQQLPIEVVPNQQKIHGHIHSSSPSKSHFPYAPYELMSTKKMFENMSDAVVGVVVGTSPKTAKPANWSSRPLRKTALSINGSTSKTAAPIKPSLMEFEIDSSSPPDGWSPRTDEGGPLPQDSPRADAATLEDLLGPQLKHSNCSSIISDFGDDDMSDPPAVRYFQHIPSSAENITEEYNALAEISNLLSSEMSPHQPFSQPTPIPQRKLTLTPEPQKQPDRPPIQPKLVPRPKSTQSPTLKIARKSMPKSIPKPAPEHVPDIGWPQKPSHLLSPTISLSPSPSENAMSSVFSPTPQVPKIPLARRRSPSSPRTSQTSPSLSRYPSLKSPSKYPMPYLSRKLSLDLQQPPSVLDTPRPSTAHDIVPKPPDGIISSRPLTAFGHQSAHTKKLASPLMRRQKSLVEGGINWRQITPSSMHFTAFDDGSTKSESNGGVHGATSVGTASPWQAILGRAAIVPSRATRNILKGEVAKTERSRYQAGLMHSPRPPKVRSLIHAVTLEPPLEIMSTNLASISAQERELLQIEGRANVDVEEGEI
jgi:hypothetical protein